MLNILFPKECLICSKVGNWLCSKCKSKLIRTLPNCYICKTLSNNYITHAKCTKEKTFEKVITIWKYNEYSKKLIHNFKYKHRFQVGNYIFSLIEKELKNINFKNSILIPVPSNTQKIRDRGFNPTQNICQLIQEEEKITIHNNLLYKKTSTFDQASLSYDERRDNVYNLFEVNVQQIQKISKYKQIIIVDDIITTGSTLNEIYKTLKPHIPENIKIYGLSIFQSSFKKYESKKYLESS